MDFYLTLPSTSSMAMYPENTQSDYTTRLPQTLQLTGSWKVGVSEVHIPVTWYNVDHTNDTFVMQQEKLHKEEEMKISVKGGEYIDFDLCKALNSAIPLHYRNYVQFNFAGDTVRVILKNGYKIRFPRESDLPLYFGMEELKDGMHLSINNQILINKPTFFIVPPNHNKPVVREDILQVPHGRYETASDLFSSVRSIFPDLRIKLLPSSKTYLKCPQKMAIIFPSTDKGFGEMLGFDTFDTPLRDIKSRYTMDLNRGIYGIYLYSDLILPQMVGDTHGELLRVINPGERTSNNDSIVQIYERPDYYPLAKNVFESVRVYLRTDDGEPLSFKSGKVLVKLHFKYESGI